MPVWKYKTLDEMNRHQRRWLKKGDPRIITKIRSIWDACETLLQPAGTLVPRGIRKYRSVEEADADRQRWEDARIRWIRENRVRKP